MEQKQEERRFDRYKQALEEGRIVRCTGEVEQDEGLAPSRRIVTWWIVKKHGDYIGFRADDSRNQDKVEKTELDTMFALYNTDIPKPRKIPELVKDIRDDL